MSEPESLTPPAKRPRYTPSEIAAASAAAVVAFGAAFFIAGFMTLLALAALVFTWQDRRSGQNVSPLAMAGAVGLAIGVVIYWAVWIVRDLFV